MWSYTFMTAGMLLPASAFAALALAEHVRIQTREPLIRGCAILIISGFVHLFFAVYMNLRARCILPQCEGRQLESFVEHGIGGDKLMSEMLQKLASDCTVRCYMVLYILSFE